MLRHHSLQNSRTYVGTGDGVGLAGKDMTIVYVALVCFDGDSASESVTMTRNVPSVVGVPAMAMFPLGSPCMVKPGGVAEPGAAVQLHVYGETPPLPVSSKPRQE